VVEEVDSVRRLRAFVVRVREEVESVVVRGS